jgi:ADP-ribosylglycohydrolase
VQRKTTIKSAIEERFDYDLTRSLDAIRPTCRFDVSCQGFVPESLVAFLASTDYESAIRSAIRLGRDADTMACIAGGLAQAFYGGVPGQIAGEVRSRLPEGFLDVLDRFESRFGSSATANPSMA